MNRNRDPQYNWLEPFMTGLALGAIVTVGIGCLVWIGSHL